MLFSCRALIIACSPSEVINNNMFLIFRTWNRKSYLS